MTEQTQPEQTQPEQTQPEEERSRPPGRAWRQVLRSRTALAMAMLDVDPLGLDLMDRKLLEAVIQRFDGGPVGLDNVAAAIGEEPGTIEDVIEPYLIQQGYLQRTPRGRIATLAAYRHFGVVAPSTTQNDLLAQAEARGAAGSVT